MVHTDQIHRHCPEKVVAALESFGSNVTILQPFTKYTDPILRISYLPTPPAFTIRTIVDTISAIPSPSGAFLKAKVYHPPSLEDRAQVMQAREKRALLLRLIFSVIVAIPTFIIAVVYMSLVPKDNHTRMWFMQPIWAGNASRLEWAMLFLSTPVMVYSAGLFHRRSLKELYSLWRKGSRTPVWKRFVRFGSMNLLASGRYLSLVYCSDALFNLGIRWRFCGVFFIDCPTCFGRFRGAIP